MEKITLIIITGFISSFLYGISTESILKNFVEHKETLKLSDFKHVKDHKGNNPEQKKAIYRSKETGRLWMIDKIFDQYSFRQYVIGDLFRLALGDRAPELRLIKNSKGKLMLGSEFIPKFKSVIDFFDVRGNRENAKTLNECFPTGCESIKFGKSLRIS